MEFTIKAMKWWLILFFVLVFIAILILIISPKKIYEPSSYPYIINYLGFGSKTSDPLTPQAQNGLAPSTDVSDSSLINDNLFPPLTTENKRLRQIIDVIEPVKAEIEQQVIKIKEKIDDIGKVNLPIKDVFERLTNCIDGKEKCECYSRIGQIIDVDKVKEEWRQMKSENPKLRLTLAQHICRRTFEAIFAVPFPEIRPDFLKNPETDGNLELDGYNEDLGIAFEFNGEQHYIWPHTKWPMSKREFVQQCRRDMVA